MSNYIRKAANRSVDFVYEGWAGYDDVAEFDYEDHIGMDSEDELFEDGFIGETQEDFYYQHLEYLETIR
jgi:hypothetical protein